MISLVTKSNKNANWSFYQNSDDLSVIVKRNRVVIAFGYPEKVLSDKDACKFLYREIRRYGESLYKYNDYGYRNNRNKKRYDNRRKTKYGY